MFDFMHALAKKKIFNNSLMQQKMDEIEKLNKIYNQIINHNKWVIPSTGLLPSIVEDINRPQFSVQLLNRVYVGNLGTDILQEDLREYFGVFGVLTGVNISLDPDSGRSRGFGFIEFDNPHAAYMAIKRMDGKSIKGRVIKASRPVNFPSVIPDHILEVDHKLLYISNISQNISEEQLGEVFSCMGRNETLLIWYDDPYEIRHKGYGYVRFRDVIAAQHTLRGLDQLELGGKRIQVGPTVIKTELPKRQLYRSRIPPEVIRWIQKIDLYCLGKIPEGHTCLILKNMIGKEDFDEDFKSELKREMDKYGHVLEVRYEIREDICIYVEYENELQVKHAFNEMNQRYFGGRKIELETCYGNNANKEKDKRYDPI
ncbi:Poly(U)-binding-splicing factor PUF60 [Astathelohania contejeani]|uniref:Poly(U)-binding-splicing factor PUF60 n=1 Tax=Astathelohania contejeani TaxID=164912 RepID=A0ABQ7HY64_9MICR|nr:Poly(U)-binding-splicing factor PUF60 [Thelohania contejeani]